MLLQDVIHSSSSAGTSSNGVSRTNYEQPWASWDHLNDPFEDNPADRSADITQHLQTSSIFPQQDSTTGNIDLRPSLSKVIRYWQSNMLPTIQRRISQQFNEIQQWEDNWDGYESKKPNRLSVVHARGLIAELLDAVISAGYLWLTPFICCDEDGYITIEWRKGERELHLDIAEKEAEYVKIWGINIEHEMDVGLLSNEDYLTLWEWLLDG